MCGRYVIGWILNIHEVQNVLKMGLFQQLSDLIKDVLWEKYTDKQTDIHIVPIIYVRLSCPLLPGSNAWTQ